jgi:hypothetical protein
LQDLEASAVLLISIDSFSKIGVELRHVAGQDLGSLFVVDEVLYIIPQDGTRTLGSKLLDLKKEFVDHLRPGAKKLVATGTCTLHISDFE